MTDMGTRFVCSQCLTCFAEAGRFLAHIAKTGHDAGTNAHRMALAEAAEEAAMETAPMKPAELGRYMCVARGGCLHTDRVGSTIRSDGVWVKSPDPDPLNPDSRVYSSAHRDCYEAWAARAATEGNQR